MLTRNLSNPNYLKVGYRFDLKIMSFVLLPKFTKPCEFEYNCVNTREKILLCVTLSST